LHVQYKHNNQLLVCLIFLGRPDPKEGIAGKIKIVFKQEKKITKQS